MADCLLFGCLDRMCLAFTCLTAGIKLYSIRVKRAPVSVDTLEAVKNVSATHSAKLRTIGTQTQRFIGLASSENCEELVFLEWLGVLLLIQLTPCYSRSISESVRSPKRQQLES